MREMTAEKKQEKGKGEEKEEEVNESKKRGRDLEVVENDEDLKKARTELDDEKKTDGGDNVEEDKNETEEPVIEANEGEEKEIGEAETNEAETNEAKTDEAKAEDKESVKLRTEESTELHTDELTESKTEQLTESKEEAQTESKTGAQIEAQTEDSTEKDKSEKCSKDKVESESKDDKERKPTPFGSYSKSIFGSSLSTNMFGSSTGSNVFGSGFFGKSTFGSTSDHSKPTPFSSFSSNPFMTAISKDKKDEDATEEAENDEEEQDAGADFVPVAHLIPPKKIETGEEMEESVFSCRAKLYSLDPSQAEQGWKERGTGVLHLNVMKSTDQNNSDSSTKKSRIVMRADGVLKVILNLPLVKGTEILKGLKSSLVSEKFVRILAWESQKPMQYALRMGNGNTATEFFDTATGLLDH
ncbi:hypothetical protein V1512DRAFT_258446 [Lipomyces arxii]|uniref:uncharacterized protein n=1 Tax=Lipomyces arxii TaxID=56418 RepID=UPI0034CFC040